jgi:hypothetical protein
MGIARMGETAGTPTPPHCVEMCGSQWLAITKARAQFHTAGLFTFNLIKKNDNKE